MKVRLFNGQYHYWYMDLNETGRHVLYTSICGHRENLEEKNSLWTFVEEDAIPEESICMACALLKVDDAHFVIRKHRRTSFT